MDNAMQKRLMLILIIAIPSWYFTDMHSPERLYSYVLPIINFICVILFCLWLVAFFATIGKRKKP
jgi:hypothetical protein